MAKELEADYEFTRAQIAELESLRAKVAEIERQEPVGYKMTQEELLRTDGRTPVLWFGHLPYGSHLYAAPAISQQVDVDVDELAQFIREVDGQNKLGAGLLAEALVDRFLPRFPDVAARIAELEAEVARLNESLEAKITICGDERITSLREKLKVAKAQQCTSPWVDSPPCTGIQRVLDKLKVAREVLAVAEVGSCSCQVKSHNIEYHSTTCKYRIFGEALAMIGEE